MSLKKIWNKLQYKMDTSTWFEPSPAVRDILKEEGWNFRETFRAVASPSGFGCMATVITPETPEGETVYGKPENMARYMEARRAAADKVYKAAAPN